MTFETAFALALIVMWAIGMAVYFIIEGIKFAYSKPTPLKSIPHYICKDMDIKCEDCDLYSMCH